MKQEARTNIRKTWEILDLPFYVCSTGYVTMSAKKRVWVIGKKIFSLSLLFNALLTIAYSVGILAGFYWLYNDWHPYAPYVVNGNLFWIAVIAGIINISPSAFVGRKLHTGRFLFHHYFYGLIVLSAAIAYVAIFIPENLLNLFFVNDTSVAVNIGRFFILGGLTLLLDDLPDLAIVLERGLAWLDQKAIRSKKIIYTSQGIAGFVSLYLFVAILLFFNDNPGWITLANCILAGTICITGLCSVIFAYRGWLGKEETQKAKKIPH
jgi:hypothetical protein